MIAVKFMPLRTAQRFVFFALIPLVAGLVVLRQGYLSKFDELSTWKGGGMGMFASADSTATRFLQFFVESNDGRREPVVGLTESQNVMMRRVLWYPRPSALEPLAASIRRTSFVASDEPSPVRSYSETGELLSSTGRRHYLLHARGVRPAGQEPNWKLIADYHTLVYDPVQRRAAFRLVHTWTFPNGSAP